MMQMPKHSKKRPTKVQLERSLLIVLALILTQCIRRVETPSDVAPPTPEQTVDQVPGNQTGRIETSVARFEKKESIPVLVKQRERTKLLVDGKPFFLLAGELGNSSASDAKYMQPIWPKLQAMGLNTLLAPVSWELVEKEEGQFDFSTVRWLIERARMENLRLVLLWFGSWKNSMSSYAPSWVKQDHQRFPRARSKDGVPQEILTPFAESNLGADRRAFADFMRFLREFDGERRTVLMVQVQNEIGMLPSARDYHPAAVRAFTEEVPTELVSYLQKNQSKLVPHVKSAWENAGKNASGTWESVFGKGLHTDEIFMAWHFGRYVEAVTSAGKKEYPLPMFLNAALNRPGVLPGDYPSAGPLPHLLDIWRAAAPSIDLFTPDFYNPDFKKWNDAYTAQGDALLIPEIRFDETVGAKALYAFGHYNCVGFSPFSIESIDSPEESTLAKSYALLQQILPQAVAQRPNDVEGVWLTKEAPEMSFVMDGVRFIARHDLTLGWSDESVATDWPHVGAVIVRVAPYTYYVAGTGVVFTFESAHSSKRAGIDEIYEGSFVEEKWVPGRSMNGDQSHQGRHLRIPNREWGIQRIRLYSYE